MRIFDDDAVAVAPLPLGRVVWAGPLTVAAALFGVHAVRYVALLTPGVRHDSFALGWTAVTADTTILCTAAVIVFTLTCAFHDRPVSRFRRIASAALLVSFLPILTTPQIGNLETIVAVAAMHVTAYAVCVTLLPGLVVGSGRSA